MADPFRLPTPFDFLNRVCALILLTHRDFQHLFQLFLGRHISSAFWLAFGEEFPAKARGKTRHLWRPSLEISLNCRRISDVSGAFAINGEVNSADVYANPQLFRSLWPKLL